MSARQLLITYDPDTAAGGGELNLFEYLLNEFDNGNIIAELRELRELPELRRMRDLDIHESEPPIIVVGCEGGLVQGASSNVQGMAMIVLDYDTEGCDDDEITRVPQPETDEIKRAVVGLHHIEHDESWVKQIAAAAGVIR